VSSEFKYLVRIHGSNLHGTKNVVYGLCGIKGIGESLAQAVIKALGLNPSMRLGKISDADLERLVKAVENPGEVGIPTWMFNRRKDRETGEDIHLLGSDLTIRQRDDIELMKDTGSWKGNRHARGLKVRGQRTKTSARKGRVIGVSRKRIEREQRDKKA